MKSFLIKFGKVLNSIKRDGAISGFRKSFFYGAVFLKGVLPVEKGDILFVSGGVGDSARYRTHNVAEELRSHTVNCSVIVADNPWILNYAKKFKIFVFHKVIIDEKIRKFIKLIKTQQKEIIFDTDDLLFDSAYFDQIDYFKNINSLEKKNYAGGLGAKLLDDPYVKTATTTTTFLGEKLKAKNKQVFVVSNKLSNKDLEITENIIKHKAHNIKQETRCSMLHAPCAMIKLGYFSGSIGHNKDFATIVDALMEIMEKYSNVRLVLAGPLDIENKLNKFKSRIEQLSFASRAKHFENISNVDINLIPLEIGNPFCEAKSELKFFEAGILEVPTVAVRNQTFSDAITNGVDGFLAGNTEEWAEKLSKLIEDENLRKSMGEKARGKALDDYTNKNSHNEEYYGYLKNILDKSK